MRGRVYVALIRFMPAPAPIDAVYTWVDGSRPDYRALLERYSGRPRDLNPERFRDPFDLLRYSLRSLALHAPWVRHVYLFTCRPQVPAWLRLDHPRLRIVHHDEVGADPATLPTFNSNVIESYLHLLPGISDRFLYLNDDYLLGAPIAPGDFFTSSGRLKVFGTLIGHPLRSRVYERQRISFGLVEHGPTLVDRAEWAAMQTNAPVEFARLRTHRFRQPDDLRPDRLYRWHLLTHRRDHAAAVPFWSYLPQAAFIKITSDLPRFERAAARLLRSPRKFICLNDDQGPVPNPAVIAATRALLATLYPAPGPFERASS
jgi:hypothetical protein